MVLRFIASIPFHVCVCSQLFVASGTVANQTPLSMGFPRQEYLRGFPFPPPGDLPDPEFELLSLATGRRTLLHHLGSPDLTACYKRTSWPSQVSIGFVLFCFFPHPTLHVSSSYGKWIWYIWKQENATRVCFQGASG